MYKEEEAWLTYSGNNERWLCPISTLLAMKPGAVRSSSFSTVGQGMTIGSCEHLPPRSPSTFLDFVHLLDNTGTAGYA